MCGLLGFSGPEGNNFDLDKIRLLFMWNQERGKDSYGYYTPKIGIVKDIGRIEDGMCKKDFNIPETNLFVGHVRSKTIGEVSKANAHPFNYGNIVLAMNGTLTNTWDLCREYGFPLADFDVDSQLLTAILNKDQNKNVLSKILGGCALIYTDTNTGNLYCYRNLDRPLYRGNINGGMYISSIENTLKVIGCTDVKEFKTDNLYEIKNGSVIGTYKVKRAVPKPINTSALEVSKNGSFLNVDFTKLKSEELIGRYLLLKTNHWEHYPENLLEGFAYKVISPAEKSYEIVILNELEEAVVVSKHIFEEKFPILTAGDYAFCKLTLEYEDPKDGNFAQQDDLLLLVKKNKGGFYAKNILTGECANIGDIEVRFAYPKEIAWFKRQYFISDNNKVNLPAVIDTPPVIEKPKTEEDIYKDEVLRTDFDTFEQLAQFTVNSIEEIISDLKEIELNPNVSNKVKRLEVLTENFTDKVISLNLI